MGPYTKRYKRSRDEWEIEEYDGHVIAALETEHMANCLMAALLGLCPEPPQYPEDVPQGECEHPDAGPADPEDPTVYRCPDCGETFVEGGE